MVDLLQRPRALVRAFAAINNAATAVSAMSKKGMVLLAALLLTTELVMPGGASAHHLMELFHLTPSPLAGLLSGLGHPLLGPDHLLFLLALGLVGLQRPRSWVLGLLVTGLAASGLGLLLPGLPGAEILVALSLVVVALVQLRRLPAVVLLPCFALHGYVLSASVIGWEPTPVALYLLGLAMSQGLLLLVSLKLVRHWASRWSTTSTQVAAGVLIGVGAAFGWSALVP